MCGIAGFTLRQDTPGRDNRAILDAMLNATRYRGPDQTGAVITPEVALGHNRLTIIEPQGGRQPRAQADCAGTLVYNGEIYAHRDFHAEIAAAGHVLRDHCDTETLYWLVNTHGVTAAVKMLDGMFSFAYHDAADNTVYLARDRFGQKPLFYAEANGQLIFASEIKALLRHPALTDCSADIDALSLYLMMEYVPGRATGLHGIHELPPGHVLSWSAGRVRISPYWQTSDVPKQAALDVPVAEKRLECLLSQAVQEQLVADVPVGIFLSGGLDSSLVAAMAKQHHTNVATFTVKFPQAGFDESSFAEAIAARIGTRHTTIRLGKQSYVDGLEELLGKVDQPFADASLLPTYLLCQATKKHVKVALGGDGADELMFGYPNFKAIRFARMMQFAPTTLGKAVEWLATQLPMSSAYMNSAFLLRQFSYGIGLPARLQSVYWMSALAARDQGELWLSDSNHEQHIFEKVADQMDTDSRQSLLESCRQHFLGHYLPGNILQKTDRASMYSSLEVRAPFLSTDVVDHALSIPHQHHFKNGRGKLLLRSVAQNFLPPEIVQRRKHGFALPVSSLICTDLRDIVEPVLLDRSNPMYAHIKHARVAELWSQHLSQRLDHGKKLWALFMLAAFFRNTLQSA